MSRGLVIALAIASLLPAQGMQEGRNALTVRGRRQDIYMYRGAGSGPRLKVLFAPGDGGWRGVAVSTAQTVASWGYEVYGFDTKRYLESFTQGKATLTEAAMAADMVQVAEAVRAGSPARVILMGWSQGAGMAVLTASTPSAKAALAGIALIGLPETAVLGWRFADTLAVLALREPNQPAFRVEPLMPAVSPLPLWMIYARGDEYTTPEVAGTLFAAAREPRRLVMVDGGNHRFDGKRDVFQASLKEGLVWIASHSR